MLKTGGMTYLVMVFLENMLIKMWVCIGNFIDISATYLSKWYNFQNINVNLRHKASSTEDLKTLLQAEKELVNHLNVTKDRLKENTALRKVVDDYLQMVDYDL